MAHPMNDHRAYKVERQRADRMTSAYDGGHADAEEDHAMIKRMVKPSAMKGYAAGGAVSKPGEFKKGYAKRDAQDVEGGSAKERLDRPGRAMRAKGGRTKSKHGTHVNVIVAPQHGAAGGPMPMPMAAPRPAAPPPAPPPAVPPMAGVGAGGPPMMPPGGMPMGGGMPPGGMPPRPMAGPIRSHGGRTYASGGRISDGPAWNEGLKAGTPVQNNPSGKSDQRDVSRSKPITYATGGPVYAPQKGGMAPHLPAGSGGGKARIAKAHMAKRGAYGKGKAK